MAPLDRAAAEAWIRERVAPAAPIEVAEERPWSTVLRVPTNDGPVWFKACAPVQAFEPRLAAALAARWPGRVAEVLAHDEERAWLLLADAGTPIGAYGNPPEAWLAVLPEYAELQRGEAVHGEEHIAGGVPDLRLERLPGRYGELIERELPIDADERERLRGVEPRVAELCRELAGRGIPETIQHDDLHMLNVYARDGELRVLDWGDACVSHPFASLVETFRFLESVNRLPPDHPWYARLRDAYLEPWGEALVETFELAVRVGAVAHAVAWARQRDHLPEAWRVEFDVGFSGVLRRALAALGAG